jgi:hypothetical protein
MLGTLVGNTPQVATLAKKEWRQPCMAIESIRKKYLSKQMRDALDLVIEY